MPFLSCVDTCYISKPVVILPAVVGCSSEHRSCSNANADPESKPHLFPEGLLHGLCLLCEFALVLSACSGPPKCQVLNKIDIGMSTRIQLGREQTRSLFLAISVNQALERTARRWKVGLRTRTQTVVISPGHSRRSTTLQRLVQMQS